jgi:hypothetical protein
MSQVNYILHKVQAWQLGKGITIMVKFINFKFAGKREVGHKDQYLNRWVYRKYPYFQMTTISGNNLPGAYPELSVDLVEGYIEAGNVKAFSLDVCKMSPEALEELYIGSASKYVNMSRHSWQHLLNYCQEPPTLDKYVIYYDYTDDYGYECCNCQETFYGDWFELQDCIKAMRKNGCYNINATLVDQD